MKEVSVKVLENSEETGTFPFFVKTTSCIIMKETLKKKIWKEFVILDPYLAASQSREIVSGC